MLQACCFKRQFDFLLPCQLGELVRKDSKRDMKFIRYLDTFVHVRKWVKHNSAVELFPHFLMDIVGQVAVVVICLIARLCWL